MLSLVSRLVRNARLRPVAWGQRNRIFLFPALAVTARRILSRGSSARRRILPPSFFFVRVTRFVFVLRGRRSARHSRRRNFEKFIGVGRFAFGTNHRESSSSKHPKGIRFGTVEGTVTEVRERRRRLTETRRRRKVRIPDDTGTLHAGSRKNNLSFHGRLFHQTAVNFFRLRTYAGLKELKPQKKKKK